MFFDLLILFHAGDGNNVAVSTRGSKVLLKGMTYSELEVCFLFHKRFSLCSLIMIRAYV